MTRTEDSRFLERIDRGETIEPKDEMPDRYRAQLTRIISQHAHSEVIGMLPEGNWVTRAPSLRRKMILVAKIQDEGGHGLYLYGAAETLGADRERMYGALLSGKAKYSNVFSYPALSWADVGVIGWIVDGAAIVNQTMLARCSYGPYSRAMIRICKEESFHNKQGYELVAGLMKGTEAQRRMAQDALDRWWWPTLMMFGPHDSDSANSADLERWKIKLQSNDTLRQRFVDRTVPQAHAIELQIPDPDLTYDEESRHWHIGPIDWEEFRRVVSGLGPCSRERLDARRRAHEDGVWVRRAAATHAAKHGLPIEQPLKRTVA